MLHGTGTRTPARGPYEETTACASLARLMVAAGPQVDKDECLVLLLELHLTNLVEPRELCVDVDGYLNFELVQLVSVINLLGPALEDYCEAVLRDTPESLQTSIDMAVMDLAHTALHENLRLQKLLVDGAISPTRN